MGERLVECEVRLFEQGRIVCRKRERGTAVFRDLGRQLERECFGEWKGYRILNGFNACRACIEWCAGLKDANLSN